MSYRVISKRLREKYQMRKEQEIYRIETSEKLKSCCHCKVLYAEAPKACRKAGQSHFYLKSEDEIATVHAR